MDACSREKMFAVILLTGERCSAMEMLCGDVSLSTGNGQWIFMFQTSISQPFVSGVQPECLSAVAFFGFAILSISAV